MSDPAGHEPTEPQPTESQPVDESADQPAADQPAEGAEAHSNAGSAEQAEAATPRNRAERRALQRGKDPAARRGQTGAFAADSHHDQVAAQRRHRGRRGNR